MPPAYRRGFATIGLDGYAWQLWGLHHFRWLLGLRAHGDGCGGGGVSRHGALLPITVRPDVSAQLDPAVFRQAKIDRLILSRRLQAFAFAP